MKKTILYAAAVLALAACSKEEPLLVEEEASIDASRIVFNIKVENGHESKGVKTAWETGDVVYAFFEDNSTQYVKMTYDGTSWAYSDNAGGTAFIVGEDAQHAKVLRLRVGERLIVCDGLGKDHHCTVTKIAPDQVEAEIFETVPCVGEPSVRVSILCGLPKGDKVDYIIQKCVETGAA